MYQYLLNKVVKDVKGFSILTARPNELESFICDFYYEHGHVFINNLAVTKEFEHVFYYEDYSKWKAYELAKKINVNVCPYCNRSYTFTVGDDIKRGTRFEYDHFFAKSTYPFLALSFFNLVPSCHICNSNFKGVKQFDLEKNIHPYIEGFGEEIVFSIKPKSIHFIQGNHSAYRLRFKKGLHGTWPREKVIAAFENITTFQLSTLYNMHKDYIDEIILKSIVYNKAYIDSLYKAFSGTLFKNKEDVERFVLGNYTEERDYPKRVLSKLTADISKELGLI